MQRYADGQANSSARKVAAVLEDIAELIENGGFRTRRGLLFAVRQQLRGQYAALGDEILDDLEAFAESEVRFHVQLLEAGTKPTAIILTPSMRDVMPAITDTPIDVRPGRSVSIRQAIRAFGVAKVRQIELALLDGAGDTQQQLARRVRNLIPINKTQAGALARTSQNASSAIAAYKVFSGNLDVLDGYRWVSTLDGNTSDVCMGRDGEVYRFEPSSPIPPAHWGCRSVIVPVVKKKYDIGETIQSERPAIGSDGVEQVSTRITYAGWLRRQSKDFIDEKLGKARSRLYREGLLTLDQFVDSSGRTYTLRQLEALYPIIFARQ